MALIAGSLPPNTCYGTPQQLLDLFGSYLSLPGQNIVLEGKLTTNFSATGVQTVGATKTATLTVSGASQGDPVVVSFPSSTAGVIFDAFVSGANVVTIRCHYLQAITAIGQATYTVKVFKFGGTYP